MGRHFTMDGSRAQYWLLTVAVGGRGDPGRLYIGGAALRRKARTAGCYDRCMPGDRIVLFDGECNLCNRSVDFLLRHDRKRRLRFASLQSDVARTLLARSGMDALALAPHEDPDGTEDPSTIVFVDGDRLHVKSGAALRILTAIGWPWRALGAFLIIPPLLRDGVYDWIARNRFQWFGRRDTCRIPTPEERSLFLS